MEKTCKNCNTLKDLNEFNNNKNCPDGKMNVCKVCRKDNRQKCNYKVNVEKKKCPKCKIIKLAEDFNKSKNCKDGLQTYCKSCCHINCQRYYEKGGLELFIKNTFKDLLKNAENRNIKVEITYKDIIELYNKQKGLCALTGIELTYDKYSSNDKRLKNVNNISVDRIDSNKNYTLDNIQLICVKVNIIKWDLTMEDLISTCKLIVNNYENKKNKIQ